jgi:hypothetical protein
MFAAALFRRVTLLIKAGKNHLSEAGSSTDITQEKK